MQHPQTKFSTLKDLKDRGPVTITAMSTIYTAKHIISKHLEKLETRKERILF